MLNHSTQLTAEEVRAYQARGYHCPVRVFDDAEVAEYRGCFDDYFTHHREQLQKLLPREQTNVFLQTHTFLRWVYRLAAHPQVLDAVESILGPDVLIWGSRWFPKQPRDPAFVAWHQDATYWGLQPPNLVTAWIALTESTRANGCMRVVPGTHIEPMLPQRETDDPNNALSRGQEIAVEVDEARAVDLQLQPGELSLHHVGIVHGSQANNSDHPRIGIAVRYLSPDVRQDGSERQFAILARGVDRYGHFELLDPPQQDFADEFDPVRAEAVRRVRRNTMPSTPNQDGDRCL